VQVEIALTYYSYDVLDLILVFNSIQWVFCYYKGIRGPAGLVPFLAIVSNTDQVEETGLLVFPSLGSSLNNPKVRSAPLQSGLGKKFSLFIEILLLILFKR
jgi:hypothetical protein